MAGFTNVPYNTSNIQSLLLKTLRTAWFERELQPQSWKKIFEIKKADQAVEYELEMQSAGLGSLKAEGARSSITSAGEGLKTAYKINTYSNVIYLTLESIQDNLYKKEWGPQSMGFAEAQDVLRNIVVYSLFNFATSTPSFGADGRPLLSTNHQNAFTTYSNTFTTPAQLSLSSLNQLTQQIQLFTNYAGYPTEANAKRLITSVQNSQTAQYLLFSPQDPTTANRAINPMFHGGYFSDGLITTSYLTDPNCYFAQSSLSHGFTFYERMPFTVQELPQSDALTYGFIGFERFARSYSTARCVAGVTFF
jgi:hypothetical protein